MRLSILGILLSIGLSAQAQVFTSSSDTFGLDFGYPDLVVLDDLTFNEEVENNILDPGETCVFSFTIKNYGKYPAREVTILPQELNNISGINIPDRMVLGDIPPGASQLIQVGIGAGMDLEVGTASFIFYILENGDYNNISVVYAVGTAR